MTKLVCAGSSLMCSFGTVQSQLAILPNNKVATAKKPAATVMDQIPNQNVISFGKCNVNPQAPVPCVPAIVAPWTPGSPTVKIANQAVLTDTCQLNCTVGGVITITNPGQQTVNVP